MHHLGMRACVGVGEWSRASLLVKKKIDMVSISLSGPSIRAQSQSSTSYGEIQHLLMLIKDQQEGAECVQGYNNGYIHPFRFFNISAV